MCKQESAAPPAYFFRSDTLLGVSVVGLSCTVGLWLLLVVHLGERTQAALEASKDESVLRKQEKAAAEAEALAQRATREAEASVVVAEEARAAAQAEVDAASVEVGRASCCEQSRLLAPKYFLFF